MSPAASVPPEVTALKRWPNAMVTRWNNAAGSYSVEAENVDGEWLDANGFSLPAIVARELAQMNINGDGSVVVEICIEFTSNGYCDSGGLYGPPANCYPPEADDERRLEQADVLVDGEWAFTLSKAAGEAMMERYGDEVEAVEVDSGAYA